MESAINPRADCGSLYGFNPLNYLMATRMPKRYRAIEPSAWIGHVPFAMALIEMICPTTVVELGTHVGISYSAFCQAILELGLPTKCWAVDTWQGDEHTGDYSELILSELRDHHDPLYATFSTLRQTTFDNARPEFLDGTIDVLHIDGYHTYEAVHHDFTTWLPKLSGRGVVLLHDTEVRDRESFGVWRLWDELSKQYPSFAFHHSFGLGVLAVGKAVPVGLQPLLAASPDEAQRIRGYFANLGQFIAELQTHAMNPEHNPQPSSHLSLGHVRRPASLSSSQKKWKRTIAKRRDEILGATRAVAKMLGWDKGSGSL